MAAPPINTSGSSTKHCDYCGKENAEEALACEGCGTPFPILIASTSEDRSQTETGSPSLSSELNARSATFVLFISIAGQFGTAFAVGLLLGVGAAIAHPTGGTSDGRNRHAVMVQKIMPLVTIAAMLGTGGAMLVASRRKVPASLRDRSPVGAAWVLGSPRHIAIGGGLGVLVALGFIALASIPALRPLHFRPGPLARMAATPGLARIMWLTTVMLLAPPIEELLFRGVLYGGYRRSFGPTRAALLTTLIFCAMHITEAIRFPLAAIAIAAMATAALWMRLRSSAIGPAMAVHLFYNGIIALFQVIASLAQP